MSLSSFHPLSAADHASNLDPLLTAVEAAASRPEILQVLERATASSAKRPRTAVERFVHSVAKPYARGVPMPLFTAEFPAHWPRFKAAWDRAPERRATG